MSMNALTNSAAARWTNIKFGLQALPKQLRYTFSLRENIRDLTALTKTSRIMMGLMLSATVVAFILVQNFGFIGWISLITGIATVMNLILVDQGRLTNYSWGVLGCAVWLIVALNNHLIGDIASQSFYFVMQFVGISVWHKNKGRDNTVQAKKLSAKNAVLYLIMTFVIYGIVLGISHSLHGAQIYLDATLLPLGIIGQVLMTYGYRSQWIAWIVLDVINVIIWTRALQADPSAGATSMLALQIMMLINSFYGQYMWLKKSQTA